MIGYIIRRIAQAAGVVLGVTAVTFGLEHLIPGSLAKAILGSRASRAEIAAFNRANGLNRPAISRMASQYDGIEYSAKAAAVARWSAARFLAVAWVIPTGMAIARARTSAEPTRTRSFGS